MERRIGLYDENYQMAFSNLVEERTQEIKGVYSKFKIMIGPLNFEGNILKNTRVLEIHYKDSEDAHGESLAFGRFNSPLCYDYADKAMQLADEFCEERGLEIAVHLNSWPEFQALVITKPKQD